MCLSVGQVSFTMLAKFKKRKLVKFLIFVLFTNSGRLPMYRSSIM